jgi:Ca2+-binding EF-hand superfamily protein
MTGQMVKLPPDEDTPEKRVDKIFRMMDHNKDHKLTHAPIQFFFSFLQIMTNLVSWWLPIEFSDP